MRCGASILSGQQLQALWQQDTLLPPLPESSPYMLRLQAQVRPRSSSPGRSPAAYHRACAHTLPLPLWSRRQGRRREQPQMTASPQGSSLLLPEGGKGLAGTAQSALGSTPPRDGSTMKFFTILLLASLASTSLAVLQEPKDEKHLVLHPTDAAAQVTPKKDHASKKDIPKEASISIEEHFSQEKVVIKSIRKPKNPKPEQPHPIPQENSSTSADPQFEETTAHSPKAATTSEENLAKNGFEFGKKVEKEMKKVINYLKNLFPRTSEVIKP
ncbi:Glycosylation-dependent cell adhesion molecule 1 [Galemys pyrenaicus]|uniref:Glycosylation-dependent cell adhesion molecule 1 n=1 Tax=Galemys pyrenaicus TaxID=202257 RepID=A0A8J6AF88_GALPY|nr:Glycosylation-dependent cell adhesion molecule 1 [Galemys pyrenaicus]